MASTSWQHLAAVMMGFVSFHLYLLLILPLSALAFAPSSLSFFCCSSLSLSVSPFTCEANQYFSVQIVFRFQRFDNFCWSAAQFLMSSSLPRTHSLYCSLCLFRTTLTCFVCHCVACCNMPVTVQQHQFAWQLIAQ